MKTTNIGPKGCQGGGQGGWLGEGGTPPGTPSLGKVPPRVPLWEAAGASWRPLAACLELPGFILGFFLAC